PLGEAAGRAQPSVQLAGTTIADALGHEADGARRGEPGQSTLEDRSPDAGHAGEFPGCVDGGFARPHRRVGPYREVRRVVAVDDPASDELRELQLRHEPEAEADG